MIDTVGQILDAPLIATKYFGISYATTRGAVFVTGLASAELLELKPSVW
jgi:hypothetical protein